MTGKNISASRSIDHKTKGISFKVRDICETHLGNKGYAYGDMFIVRLI